MTNKKIIETIQTYVSVSQIRQPEEKRKFWDQDEIQPILVPEEATTPLAGWAEIEAYWAQSKSIIATLNSTSSNHRVRTINPELAVTTYSMHWVAAMNEKTRYNGRTLAADVRVTALLRLRQGEWRFFHLMEGPVDLMTMAQQYASYDKPE